MHTLSWKIATRSAINQCCRRFATVSLRRCSDAWHSSTHRHRPCHSMSPDRKTSSTRHLLRQYFTEGGSLKWHPKQCYQYDVSRLSFGTHSGQSRSPYVVLQVSANASKSEIKAAFRKLAKQHHPDLKMHQSEDVADNTIEDGNNDGTTMAELITAYETLMNKHNEHFWTDARDSRVALACEIYTIEELRGMSMFDVYSFRVSFGAGESLDGRSSMQHESTTRNEIYEFNDDDEDDIGNTINNSQLDATPILPLHAHPDDSISDLKRHIQSTHASTWGLEDRMVDRDGLYLGWELVHCNNSSTQVKDTSSVLSYHLFLHSYGIKEGDNLHAIVRRNG